jgi:uncharacterized UBP type Zn finger protein
MHQDAHEFLNYLLNTIAEDVEKYQKKETDQRSEHRGKGHGSTHSSTNDGTDTGKPLKGLWIAGANMITWIETSSSSPQTTWVHQLFEGVFSNETKCLTCETVRP